MPESVKKNLKATPLKQTDTPFLSALNNYTDENVIPFDVPGHHLGNIDNPAIHVLGKRIYECDLNSPLGLDNLANPKGVVLESERLLAKACKADEAFFLVNGTSGGIQAMIMAACRAGDKIILPRNVHKSIINGLVLSGAVPIFVMPEIDTELEIANQPSLTDWKKAIVKNPSAKAVFVINPTYFGAVGDLKSIVEFAHERGMAVLVDEAHGAHYYFHAHGSPISAMEAGADLSSASFHKTVGSLTQSSVLLLNRGIFKREDIQKVLNVLTTTSPSSLLIASVDGARSFMASKEGRKAAEDLYELSKYARKLIKEIPGFKAVGKEHFLKHGCYDYDISKLVIELDRLNINGFELYRLLKTKYHIQMELAETYAIMGVLTIGSTKEHVDALVAALKDVSKEHFHEDVVYEDHHFDSSFPFMIVRPRSAFHAPGKVVPISEVDGAVSKEQVMMYPPGIPIICPGEVWTKELIERLKHYQKAGVTLLSNYPKGFEIIDTTQWKRYPYYEKRLKDYFRKRMTVPNDDGYRLPFEGEKHQATFMLLPYRSDTWRKKGTLAIEEFKDVAKAIAEHEPVIVGIHPRIYKKEAPEFSAIPNVSVIQVRYNDAWARDTFPIFLRNGEGQLRTVDFRFNGYGGEVDGLYSDYLDDDKLASLISRRYHLHSYHLQNFVLEGGSIATDGEGTLIVTEACLLSKGRNPQLSKEEIEEVLRGYLGVEKIIWIPHGIYLDETNEHVDNMVAYVEPGHVVMAYTEDKTDPQYQYCEETYKALRKAKDAQGRRLKIDFLPLPNPPLCMDRDEAKGYSVLKDTLDQRKAGRRLAASYVNFYQGHDFVVAPAFDIPEDETAMRILMDLFPNKTIHMVYSREILLGGGGIHCITMQYPSKEEE